MGEELPLFRMKFNGSVRLEARAERLTSDAGAVLLREALERLGIAKWLAERLVDARKPELITHPLDELLKTSLLLLGQGLGLIRFGGHLLKKVRVFHGDGREGEEEAATEADV